MTRAVIDSKKFANKPMAEKWLKDNGFLLVRGNWIDGTGKYAVLEVMPASGKIVVRVGV